MKRLNASIPDEVHHRLRIALAEDRTNFAEWVRKQIEAYLAEKESQGKRRKGKKGEGG